MVGLAEQIDFREPLLSRSGTEPDRPQDLRDSSRQELGGDAVGEREPQWLLAAQVVQPGRVLGVLDDVSVFRHGLVLRADGEQVTFRADLDEGRKLLPYLAVLQIGDLDGSEQ